MREGEEQMAVITYTVSVAGGVVTTSPALNQIKLTTGDFLLFVPDGSVGGDIFVKFTGGSKIFVAAAPDTGVMQFQAFNVDGAGNITIAFADAPGNSGGGGG